jgi:hypothetical protein
VKNWNSQSLLQTGQLVWRYAAVLCGTGADGKTEFVVPPAGVPNGGARYSLTHSARKRLVTQPLKL